MNWLLVALGIVHAVETIYGDKKSGADKKTMAKDALVAVASGVIPGLPTPDQTLATNVSQVAGTVIDQAVAIGNAAGTMQQANAVSASNSSSK